ncbi:hypothetical protein GUI12_00385 [Anaplasmataceae bacterium AB001_6]|nr:hypothetical protein GUI12_00385 [Anaplasmataceae bacterium AB001_6]
MTVFNHFLLNFAKLTVDFRLIAILEGFKTKTGFFYDPDENMLKSFCGSEDFSCEEGIPIMMMDNAKDIDE